MSAKSFFGSPTTNDGPAKFVKLDGNQILIVIIFKLQEYHICFDEIA